VLYCSKEKNVCFSALLCMMIYEFLRINACMCPLIKRQLLDVVDVSTNLNCTACLRLKKKMYTACL
jgi:hypothetical protein